MYRRREGLWRQRGSADEVNYELTGYEWLEIITFMKNKSLFILTCLFNIISCASPSILSLILGKLANILVDKYFPTGESFLESINDVSNLLLLAVFVILTCTIIQFLLESYFMPQFLTDLHSTIMSSILNQDITFFEENQTGIILSRLTDDISNVHRAYTEKVLSFIRVIFQWVFGLIVFLFQSWKVTLFTLISFPLYALVHHFGNKSIDKLWLLYNERNTAVSAKAEEILSSFRTVRSFDAEYREYSNYKQKLTDVHEIVLKTSYVQGIKEFFSTFIQWGTASFILYYSSLQAAKKEIEPGSIVVLMSVFNNWSFSIIGIFSIITDFKKSNVSAAKLLEITKRIPKIDLELGDNLNKITGQIEFKNVYFKYPSRDEYALKGLSFIIEPGQTIAIVGESGCGKSTTLSLLQRLYDIEEGEILIDNINIKNINPKYLRSQIAIVPQIPVMFSMSAKNNIRFGKPNSKRDEVINSSQIAYCHNFISNLSEGYNTQIKQTTLSGGQKQRICIARAILMSSPILLLDEATASLDTESEKMVQDALNDFRKNKTAIIVAHRLSTVRNADKIFVLDQGKIVEIGTHDELLNLNGFYTNLIKHQLI